MALKGKDGGAWKDTSAVYGKNAGSWSYAQYALAKDGGVWKRAWTDCRKYDDTDGRGWSDPTSVTTTNGTCGNKTTTVTTTRTKLGCPDDVRATTTSTPDCADTCYDISTNTCEGCGGPVVTKTAKAGTNCTGSTTGSCTSWVTVEPSTSGRPNGSYWVAWAYGNDARLIVFDSSRYWFYDQNVCVVCNCGAGEYDDIYTVQKCSVTGAYRWTDHTCFAIGCADCGGGIP